MPNDTIFAWFEVDELGKKVVVTTDPEPVAPPDWDRVDALTDEELDAAARDDPDTVVMTEEMWARARPRPNVRRIRDRLQLTQQGFAERFGVPIGTLRDWEQGRRSPDAPARALLRVIEAEPELVARALAPRAVAPDEAAED